MTNAERHPKQCKKIIAEAQQQVGSLQWVALKTKPDVASITAIAASMPTRDQNRSTAVD